MKVFIHTWSWRAWNAGLSPNVRINWKKTFYLPGIEQGRCIQMSMVLQGGLPLELAIETRCPAILLVCKFPGRRNFQPWQFNASRVHLSFALTTPFVHGLLTTLNRILYSNGVVSIVSTIMRSRSKWSKTLTYVKCREGSAPLLTRVHIPIP